MSNIIQKHNYTNKYIQHLKNTTIREYDIEDGGFSILKYKELLPKEFEKYLSSIPKQQRHREVGKYVSKHRDISIELIEGFKDVRERFYELNELDDSDILSIKKDAIFLIDKKVEIEEFNTFNFRMKNKYSSYINLSGIEFYYSTWNDTLDIKGISGEVLEFHKDYMIDAIKDVIKLSESMDKRNILKILRRFRGEYINLNLPVEFYKELSSNSFYRYKNDLQLGDRKFGTDVASDDMRELLNINYNYINFILPLINIII